MQSARQAANVKPTNTSFDCLKADIGATKPTALPADRHRARGS